MSEYELNGCYAKVADTGPILIHEGSVFPRWGHENLLARYGEDVEELKWARAEIPKQNRTDHREFVICGSGGRRRGRRCWAISLERNIALHSTSSSRAGSLWGTRTRSLFNFKRALVFLCAYLTRFFGGFSFKVTELVVGRRIYFPHFWSPLMNKLMKSLNCSNDYNG